MLTDEDVGHRVVVRRVLRGETGPSGGPASADVLGDLQLLDERMLVVRRADGSTVQVARADVVSAKRVPPRPPRRPRMDPEDLQRQCTQGWPAVHAEPMGDWLLQAAGGFTGRANSVVVCGNPGVPLDEALVRVERFYAAHGLPARAQVVVGSAWESRLLAHGWVNDRPGTGGVLVKVAALEDALRQEAGDLGGVRLSDKVSPGWLRRFRRDDVDAAVVRAVLEGPEAVSFAEIDDTSDPNVPMAIGRATVSDAWVGLYAVEVAFEQRRRGHGRAVVDTLLRWGREQGARWSYLQVTPANTAAISLYASYGFTTHHRYRYLRPV